MQKFSVINKIKISIQNLCFLALFHYIIWNSFKRYNTDKLQEYIKHVFDVIQFHKLTLMRYGKLQSQFDQYLKLDIYVIHQFHH